MKPTRSWANIAAGAGTTGAAKEKEKEEKPAYTTEKPPPPSPPRAICVRPYRQYLNVPNYPVAPIFRTENDMRAWDSAQYHANTVYSDKLYGEQMEIWKHANHWLDPPMKTSLTERDRAIGFYESRHVVGEIAYSTPHCTGYLTEEIDYVWKLIYNRADELHVCKTVADFRDLVARTILLEIPNVAIYHSWNMPFNYRYSHILWLLSQQANVFPTSAVRKVPRWKVHPDEQAKIRYALASEEFFATPEEIYPPNAIFSIPGGRDISGYCIVENMKRDKDAAKIRWIVSIAQMKAVEKVRLEVEGTPDCFRNNDDWDDWF